MAAAPSTRSQGLRSWPVSLILSALVVAACGGGNVTSSDSSTPQTAFPPEQAAQLQRVWSPTPLMSYGTSDGTFLRAAAESIDAVMDTRQDASAYPGFWNHTSPSTRRTVTSNEAISTRTKLVTGASVYTVLDVKRNPDKKVSITYCLATVSQRVDLPPQKTAILQSTLTILKQGTPPPVAQSGPESRPASDVFGEWVLDNVSLHFLRSGETGCDDATVRAVIANNSPSSPGWPT